PFASNPFSLSSYAFLLSSASYITPSRSPSPLSPRTTSFFSPDSATADTYTLSLHDALPISQRLPAHRPCQVDLPELRHRPGLPGDRKSTRLNSSHVSISYAVFCLKIKKNQLPDLTIQFKHHQHGHLRILTLTQRVPFHLHLI